MPWLLLTHVSVDNDHTLPRPLPPVLTRNIFVRRLSSCSSMDGMMDANAEHDRLRSIVDDTSSALIDVSRVGNDDFVLDPEAPKVRDRTTIQPRSLTSIPASIF